MNNGNYYQVPPLTLDEMDVFNTAEYAIDVNELKAKLFEVGMQSLKEDFESGQKFSLMCAINECASEGVPMPLWVATEYQKAFAVIHGAQKRSWDDVFGKPFRKGAQLPYIRKAQRLARSVREQFDKLKQDGIPLTPENYDEFAKRFGLNRDTLKKFLKLTEPGNTSRLF